MQCNACGHSNRDAARFCEQCGAKLALACLDCGAEVGAGAKFCDACGTPVAAPRARTEDQSLLDSTPQHIADAIRRDHSAMEGERRVVTVLFADAVGHTTISEKLDEEDVYGLMQGCFEKMQEAVHRYEGTVNQFTGDGILALFGAPIAHEDAARRAVAAALEMQRSLSLYAKEVEERHPIECSYRVGLNTGPVVVGKISDNLALDFAAVGDTVNLAARMESMAESGSVYVSENTYRVVGEYFECENLGAQDVKGKAEPVVAYRALRERSSRKRLDVAAEHGLTPYVGRDRELKVLTEYLEHARTQAHIVYVSGEAGMGKSRLLLELNAEATKLGVKWLEGHCVSYGRATSYLPFIDIIKRHAGIREGDDDARMIQRMNNSVAQWSDRSRAAVPYLKSLLSVDPGDASLAAMDPMEQRAGILEGLRALFREESATQPLVVVVEDLHWIDEKSEQALTALVDALIRLPILLVLTSRPGHKLALSEHSNLSRLALSNLKSEDSASMVEGLLETDTLPSDLIGFIGKKAEGNPFYIEEVTKSLVETGALRRDNGSYKLDQSIESLSIPDTIQEVILARIDRLDREAKGAIQLASVIGREFTVRILNRISDVESELDHLLQELRGLELIYETGYSPELSYMFKHALTHDVAYSTLLVERRRTLHRIVAHAIEELYPNRLSDHYEALAHHFEEGETWDKALDYLVKAGEKAVLRYANHDALDFLTRALKVAERIQAPYELRLQLLENRAWICFTVADYAGATSNAKEMLTIALDEQALNLEARAHSLMGLFYSYEHNFEPAEEAYRRAEEISETHGFDDTLFFGRMGTYSVHKLLNRHEEAAKHQLLVRELPLEASEPFSLGYWTFFSALDENWKGDFAAAAERAGSWRRFPPHTPMLIILNVRWSEALTLSGLGRYDEAIQMLYEIISECERMGEIAVRARATNTLGWIYHDLQDHERSMEYNHRGIEVALEEGDEPEKISNARLNWADALLARGRADAAAKQLTPVEKVIRNPRPEDRWMLWRYSQHYFHSHGKLCLLEGDHDRAISLADECLALADMSASKKYIIKARRLRGEALLASGDAAGSIQELGQAATIATDLANPAQLWKSNAVLSRCLHAAGRIAEAEQASRLARDTVDGVALELRDESLRNTFINSDEIRAIREGLTS